MLSHLLSHLLRLLRGAAPETTAAGLAGELTTGPAPLLIDIREAEEYAVRRLPGALHIPLDRLGVEAARLDPGVPAVVY